MPGDKTWLVSWHITQECATALEAARLSWQDMRAVDSIACCFTVQELDENMQPTRNPVGIDLADYPDA